MHKGEMYYTVEMSIGFFASIDTREIGRFNNWKSVSRHPISRAKSFLAPRDG